MGSDDLSLLAPDQSLERDLDAIFGRMPAPRFDKGAIIACIAMALVACGGASFYLLDRFGNQPMPHDVSAQTRKALVVADKAPSLSGKSDSDLSHTARITYTETATVAPETPGRRVGRSEGRSARTPMPVVVALLAQPDELPPTEPETHKGSDHHDEMAGDKGRQAEESRRIARLEALDAVRALRLR